MDRRQRRLFRQKTRRIGVLVATLTLAVGSLAMGNVAFASGGACGGPCGGGGYDPMGHGGSGGRFGAFETDAPGGGGGGGGGQNVDGGGGGVNLHNGELYCNGPATTDLLPAHQSGFACFVVVVFP